MVVYWITEPMEPGLTALLGCCLFWAAQVAKSSVVFSGFANNTTWYLFAVLLMSEAASQTGVAKRIGYLVMHAVGTSYSRLLLSNIILVFLLQFLIPNGAAQLAIMAPIVVGIIAVFDLGPRSNVATGLFIIVTYACSILNKMIMSGGSTILARGLIEAQTGIPVLWSQWFIAFLPITGLTIVACWCTIRWLYPAETWALPGGQQYLRNTLHAMGPWSGNERKVLGLLLLAVALWATDWLHRMSPALIALGIGLLLAFPKLGVLDTKAVRSVNILLILFVGGTLSMGNVLTDTKALHLLTDGLVAWMTPLLSNAFQAAISLYWGGFLYHFLVASEYAMVSTALPVLLQLAQDQGYNPVAVGLMWSFAGGGKLFVYQNSILILGYSYGYFQGRDLLKVGGVLTLVEGLFLMLLVPLYWPLIGVPWRATPVVPTRAAAALVQPWPVEISADRGFDSGPAQVAVDADPAGQQWAVPEILPMPPVRAEGVASARVAEEEQSLPSGKLPQLPGRAVSPIERGKTMGFPGEPNPPEPEKSQSMLIQQSQIRLRQLGFDPGPIDGFLGPRTKAALYRYQTVHGLPVTRKLDSVTQEALGIR
jgi:anion transporter